VVAINSAEKEMQTRFRWTYVIVPVALFLISLILAASFYPLLSDEIAYHFQNDIPDRTMSRGAFIGWMVLPQVFFAILAIVVVRIVMLTSRYLPQRNSPLPNLLPLMGNIIALPQIVLVFAMISFFLYNAYQIRLISIWIFTLIVMVAGLIVLGVFFVRAIRQSRRLKAEIRQE
jgi:uncharacterized membrane protein